MSALESAQPCPLCGTLAEPELDGDVMYYECEDDLCVGYAWGYTRLGSVAEDAECAIGVPLAVRQRASQFDPPVEVTGVNLGSTIRRRPGL